jgi:hypothetical protein
MAITAVYVDTDTFTVVDDRTTEFAVGRRVKCDCGTDGYKYGTISASAYSSPNTTVDLTAGSDNLTSNLVGVWYAIIVQGVTGTVPIHIHDGAEGSGGNIDVDDTPVNGVTATPISSNWAYDHDADVDAHHAQSHNIAGHSDTTATGAELETLTDNSIADTLHRHSELVASDGSPDPALSIDADGKASFPAGTGINEFSTDGTLAGDSDDAAPTEKAIKTYIDSKVIFKSFNITTQGLGASPDVYTAGFYEAPAADADLTQANLTQTLGTANKSEAAHAFLVASGAGVTDGSDLIITVTGISITDAGVRNATDSEVIVADATAMSTDEYFETTKKWLGQITYTLSSTAGTAYNATFNYGFAKYEDYGNRGFTVTDFEVVGLSGANDTDLDIILFHHHSTGWTYNAAAFVPGGTKICQMSTDHSTDDQIFSSEHFAYKRASLSTSVDGSGIEGVVVLVTSSANNAVEYANIHIGVTL